MSRGVSRSHIDRAIQGRAGTAASAGCEVISVVGARPENRAAVRFSGPNDRSSPGVALKGGRNTVFIASGDAWKARNCASAYGALNCIVIE